MSTYEEEEEQRRQFEALDTSLWLEHYEVRLRSLFEKAKPLTEAEAEVMLTVALDYTRRFFTPQYFQRKREEAAYEYEEPYEYEGVRRERELPVVPYRRTDIPIIEEIIEEPPRRRPARRQRPMTWQDFYRENKTDVRQVLMQQGLVGRALANAAVREISAMWKRYKRGQH